MSSDTSEESNKNINSENIFDEFTDSHEIKKELDAKDKNDAKDIYFYLKKLSVFFLVINILLFLFVILCSIYVYIQNNEDKKEHSYLAPICSIFLGSDSIYNNTCYGVTYSLKEYTTKLDDLSQQQSTTILPLLGDKYSLENFNLSKKVDFLLNKGETRLKPLEILSAFDMMKDTFSATDKLEISCYNISISNDIIDMTCDSFSADWNTGILSVEDTQLKTVSGGGTSISKASSFVNFLENYSDTPFTIVEKPDYYTSETVTMPSYTRKTTFQFSLRYAEIATLDLN